MLHLLPADTIQARVQQEPSLLYELSWKRLAVRHPDICIVLIEEALKTADDVVALNKRWAL